MQLYFDGKPVSHFGLRLRPGAKEQLIANTRDRLERIPYRNGAYDFGSDLGEGLLSYPLEFITAKTPEERQQVMRVFANFITDRTGRPRYFKLSTSYELDKYLRVRYAGNLPISRQWVKTQFDLSLMAPLPFYQSVELYISNFEITANIERFLVVSGGDVETPPLFRIENTGNTTLNGFRIELYREVE